MRTRPLIKSTTSNVLRRPSAFDLISLDFVGPRQHFTESWYYLVIIDHCSRFVVLYPAAAQTSQNAIQALRLRWVPYFGVPKAILCDNHATFKSTEFVDYITKELCSHLVYTSINYPQGNAINESSHRSIDHGIRARLLQDPLISFPQAVAAVSTAYNAAYQTAIRMSPFEVLFGKPLQLPGLQDFAVLVPEDSRRESLNIASAIRQLAPHLPDPQSFVRPVSLEVGDFVIFPRSPHEIDYGSSGTEITKYTPTWSLPSRVLEVHDQQILVREFATNRDRRVPFSSVRRLPTEVPPSIAQLNWHHIKHSLPRRWSVSFDSSLLPPQYRSLADEFTKAKIAVESSSSSTPELPSSSSTTKRPVFDSIPVSEDSSSASLGLLHPKSESTLIPSTKRIQLSPLPRGAVDSPL